MRSCVCMMMLHVEITVIKYHGYHKSCEPRTADTILHLYMPTNWLALNTYRVVCVCLRVCVVASAAPRRPCAFARHYLKCFHNVFRRCQRHRAIQLIITRTPHKQNTDIYMYTYTTPTWKNSTHIEWRVLMLTRMFNVNYAPCPIVLHNLRAPVFVRSVCECACVHCKHCS